MIGEEKRSVRAPKAVHRTDIDGLRAIAVLPVIAYHARFGLLPGGFIGVDVFFVISGYLITQVLLKDIQGDRFSLVNFYERRVRRIAPALLGVLFGTFIVCIGYGLPTELLDYSKSLIAATLSASNFYFWHTSGYFADAALTQPLLHTWSLAVEEQFYIFWPLCLLAGWRLFRHRLLAVVLMVTVASFALSAVGAFVAESGTFYMLPTRAWELFLGALLAIGMFPKPLPAAARNVLSLIGILLIAGSAHWLNAEMPFPGALAAPACMGTFLVILGGRDGPTFVGRVLSWRPVAFVGLISYSLYLWHWPLIVFQRDYGLLLIPGAGDREQKLFIIGISFIAGALSWKLIEQPFRVGLRRPSRSVLFKSTATAAAVVIACGAAAWAGGGFPSRYTAQQLYIATYLIPGGDDITDPCFLARKDGPDSFPASCLATSTAKPNILILGDSHAWELISGLRSVYTDMNFMETAASDCLPLLHHDWKDAPYCVHAMDTIFNGFIPTHRIDGVILAGRWDLASVPRVAQTLAWFHDRRIPVTLVGPTLMYDLPLPRVILTAERRDEPKFIKDNEVPGLWAVDAQMAAVARANGVRYISMLKMFCPDQCNLLDETGMPLIWDKEHITRHAAVIVAQTLKKEGFLNATQAAAGL